MTWGRSPTSRPGVEGGEHSGLRSCFQGRVGRRRGFYRSGGWSRNGCGRRGLGPPLRAVGRTFEFSFDLPEPRNAGGRPPSRAKPAGKLPRENPTSTPPRKGTPKAEPTKRRPESATAEVEARERRREYDRRRNQTPERGDQKRLFAQEKRRKAKALGLCGDCLNPAIPGKTRCSTCAKKHRE